MGETSPKIRAAFIDMKGLGFGRRVRRDGLKRPKAHKRRRLGVL
jgi:hypothetical protein